MIHWEYIKGAFGSADTTLYTFLKFSSQTYNTTLTQAHLPTLSFSDSTTGSDGASAGRILVSGDINQDVAACLTFTNTNGIKVDTIKGQSGTTWLTFNNTTASFFNQIDVTSTQVTIKQPTSFSNQNIQDVANVHAATANIDGQCQANYFNATSDRRAKTNIKPITQSMLPLVRNLQLYSFTYKDMDTPSIGIIAQDVQDVNIEGFSLVDNKEASGQDMDYMSIHESKLVYILWKAVQEQQLEIEALKEQIKKGLN